MTTPKLKVLGSLADEAYCFFISGEPRFSLILALTASDIFTSAPDLCAFARREVREAIKNAQRKAESNGQFKGQG